MDQDAWVDEQRATFAERQTRPLPDDVTARPTTLGGRLALALEVTDAGTGGIVLHLHGGGYVVGSARTGASLAAGLARRTGARAVSLDYRLAPEHPFPAAVEDGLAAYRELLDTGVRPDEIVVTGDSAGGGLAIATLVAAREAGLPQPAATAVFSPWVDFTLAGQSMQSKHGIDPIFTRDRLADFAYRYLGDRAADAASPLSADLRGLPPLLVQVGSYEVLLDDAVRLAGRAGDADIDVTLEIWAGMSHVFQNVGGELPEADTALDNAGRFLSQRLRAPERSAA